MLSDTVLPSYVNLFVAELNRSLMNNGARIVADVDNVPTLMSWRQTLTESAQRAKFMSTNERRRMVGLPPVDDSQADTPLELLELRLKQEAIAAQGGVPSNTVGRLPRLVEDEEAALSPPPILAARLNAGPRTTALPPSPALPAPITRMLTAP